jgi:hypothetical protein
MTNGGLSKVRLARVGEVVGGYVERGEVPGAVTLLARRGEVHVGAAGTLAAGGGDPVRRDTLFRVTSMTKPITAAAAMILVEECKLRLDEPVDRLLPELSGRRVLKRLDGPVDDTVPATRPITVRDPRGGGARAAAAELDPHPAGCFPDHHLDHDGAVPGRKCSPRFISFMWSFTWPVPPLPRLR